MLEKIDLSKKLSKEDYKTYLDDLTNKLALLQRECQNRNIPIMIIFEGLDAAGKGTLINQLIHPLDPRGFFVHAIKKETEEESMHPFLWRFWTKLPEKGRIAIFDRSWYRKVSSDCFDDNRNPKELPTVFEDIRSYEEQLSTGGMGILKFFLFISKKEQAKRFQVLEDKKETAWRVSSMEKKRNKSYNKYLNICETMLSQTDTACAPWTIVESTNKNFATIKIMKTVVQYLTEIIAKADNKQEVVVPVTSDLTEILKESTLSTIDLDKSLTKEAYKKKLEKLQKRMAILHSELYQKRIPLVLAFEGWDAGGKGGAIKRLTENIDPRGYAVFPVAAPNDIERKHHYLWRFWKNVPKSGHISIFDRSWYGRVMVERVEGFCKKEEWQRAYKEINHMEEQWTNSGTIVLKFWMQIDKDEQLRRFKEREDTPEKQWKITQEDWRNREKWDMYESAVNEMLIRTSTTDAPWIIIEANSKYYARIKVLETVISELEKRL